MLVLISPTSEGWKAEWTLAGKKVTKYSSLGRTGNGTRDLRVGRQRSYHCANPSAVNWVIIINNYDIDIRMTWISYQDAFNNNHFKVSVKENEVSTEKWNCCATMFCIAPNYIHHIKANRLNYLKKVLVFWYLILPFSFEASSSEWPRKEKEKKCYKISFQRQMKNSSQLI